MLSLGDWRVPIGIGEEGKHAPRGAGADRCLTSVTQSYRVFLVNETARQWKTTTVQSLRDQIGQLVDAIHMTQASVRVLLENHPAASSSCISQNALYS